MRTIDLNGDWRFSLDYEKAGIGQKWYLKDLKERISLPGTTDEAQYGQYILESSMSNFTRRYRYDGFAWYQRDIFITGDMVGKHLTLFLECITWESMLWVDDMYAGTMNSLTVPHEYDITGLTEGMHRITLMVDNSNLKHDAASAEEKDIYSDRDLTLHANKEKKLNCGGHHYAFRLETIWNGIVGRLELRVNEPIYIRHIDLYSDLNDKKLNVVMTIHNDTGKNADISYIFTNTLLEGSNQTKKLMWSVEKTVEVTSEAENIYSAQFDLTKGYHLWDEYSPALYELQISSSDEIKTVTYGLRHICARGKQILINDVPVYFRGTLECFVFPLTAYQPFEREYWEKIFKAVKAYGLNHVRFHTACPPETAFDVADGEGVYLQVEVPGTSCPASDEEAEVTRYLTDELLNILKYYGNHPSLCLVSMGNEQLVNYEEGFYKRHTKKLEEMVMLAKKTDARHLYTCTSHPYTPEREADDFFSTAYGDKFFDLRNESGAEAKMYGPDWPVFLTSISWGGPDPSSTSRYCLYPPGTSYNSTAAAERIEKPVIVHEVGQWSTFPNTNEISKYDGVLYAGNFAKIREGLRANGLLEYQDKMVYCSGSLAYLLYKEDIESYMRSHGLAGYQLLGLNDNPGQGTSTVGMLDSLWDPKTFTSSEEFKNFCNDRVLLLEFDKYEWTNGETFKGQIKLANYTKKHIEDELIEILMLDNNNAVLYKEAINHVEAPFGTVTSVGSFSYNLSGISKSEIVKIQLKTGHGDMENSWQIFVSADDQVYTASDIIITDKLTNEIIEQLKNGARVLYQVNSENKDLADVGFTTAFWNPIMKHQAGTNGLIIDSDHGVFKECPTTEYTHWFHWNMVNKSKSICINGYGQYFTNIVRVIDSFVYNRDLSMLMETCVGKGRLVISTIELNNEKKGPFVRQLYKSVMSYMDSSNFNPQTKIHEDTLLGFDKQTNNPGQSKMIP
jgi:hypothetical protein